MLCQTWCLPRAWLGHSFTRDLSMFLKCPPSRQVLSYCRPFAILPSRKGSICVTYVHRAAQWRKADQLFVCFGPPRIGDPATKSRWVIETITLAYESSGLPSPMRVREHSTRSMAASKALSLDVALQDVCAVAQDVCAVVPEGERLSLHM